MITNDQLPGIIENLTEKCFAIVMIEGMLIRLSLLEDGDTLHLSTPVFYGDNYIPKSVKEALQSREVVSSELLKVSFRIDEDSYSVFLNCQGPWIGNIDSVKEMLYEFSWLAEEWKQWLNEKGKGDLLPIYIKK